MSYRIADDDDDDDGLKLRKLPKCDRSKSANKPVRCPHVSGEDLVVGPRPILYDVGACT